jgi:hypothetical protein
MRLKNFINEEDETQAEILFDRIAIDCSEICEIYKEEKMFFFRGLKKSGLWHKITPREDRKPLDTKKWAHRILDEYFQSRFGWKARSEGVFAVARYEKAGFYGREYIIFPLDGYKFVYSPDVLDLFSYPEEVVKSKIGGAEATKYFYSGGVDPTGANLKRVKDVIFTELDKKHYTDKNLGEAKWGEVMFKCKAYYAINRKEYGIAAAERFWWGINPSQ